VQRSRIPRNPDIKLLDVVVGAAQPIQNVRKLHRVVRRLEKLWNMSEFLGAVDGVHPEKRCAGVQRHVGGAVHAVSLYEEEVRVFEIVVSRKQVVTAVNYH
jgi:hypothetical protein